MDTDNLLWIQFGFIKKYFKWENSKFTLNSIFDQFNDWKPKVGAKVMGLGKKAQFEVKKGFEKTTIWD